MTLLINAIKYFYRVLFSLLSMTLVLYPVINEASIAYSLVYIPSTLLLFALLSLAIECFLDEQAFKLVILKKAKKCLVTRGLCCLHS